MDTHRFDDLCLQPDQIDENKRPRLAEMLEIADGASYLLSSEGTETAAGDERMTVLIVTDGMWGIVTDTPACPEKKVEEAYHITVLTNEDAGPGIVQIRFLNDFPNMRLSAAFIE